jgi:O-antigen/teichoic acid export membrane protein
MTAGLGSAPSGEATPAARDPSAPHRGEGPPQRSRWRFFTGPATVAAIVGLQALLASIFWFEGARITSSSTLGTAAALYASLMFVNYVTGMGVAYTLARFGGGAGRDQDAWFGWSIVYTSATSLLGTVIYLSVVSSPATNLIRGVGGVALFFLLTAGMSLGPLVDVRLMASRSWGWLTLKNALIGLVRLPLALLHPMADEALWLFILIAAPQAVFSALYVFVLPGVMQGRISLHVPEAWRNALKFSFVNWLAVLATNAPAYALPLIVALRVRPSLNAAFFLASNLAVAVSLAPTAVSVVVLVEGSQDEEGFRQRARHALYVAVGISAVALVASVVLAPLVTIIYGKAFRLTAEILPVLLAACIPWSMAQIRLTEARLRHDHVTTVAITMTIGVGIVTLGALFVPMWGPWGAAFAWVGGNVAAALVGLAFGVARWQSVPLAEHQEPSWRRRRRPAHSRSRGRARVSPAGEPSP